MTEYGIILALSGIPVHIRNRNGLGLGWGIQSTNGRAEKSELASFPGTALDLWKREQALSSLAWTLVRSANPKRAKWFQDFAFVCFEVKCL